MLNVLTLRGYRSFCDYRMTDFARVNLLVGKNNCGKTSILEAIELLVSGDPSALRESALRRTELTEHGADISHVFYGHVSAPGTSFELSCPDDRQQLTATMLRPDDTPESAVSSHACLLRIAHGEQQPFLLPVDENGVLSNVAFPGVPSRAARFLDFDPRSMHAIWNSVLAEGRGTEVVEALQLLEPGIEEIAYPTGGGRRRAIELGHRDSDGRLPIGELRRRNDATAGPQPRPQRHDRRVRPDR